MSVEREIYDYSYAHYCTVYTYLSALDESVYWIFYYISYTCRRPAGMRMDGGDGSMTAANAPEGSGCTGGAWGLPMRLLSCSRAVQCLCSVCV